MNGIFNNNYCWIGLTIRIKLAVILEKITSCAIQTI